MEKIVRFQQLKAWQEAHKLVLMVYQKTKHFPSEERYALVTQIRRAAISIPANIVEGFKRRSVQDKIRFYNIAEGSLEEVKYFIILAQDLHYLTPHNPNDLMEQAHSVGRLLHGLIQSTKRRQ